jgi:hypothetical protein
MALLTGLLMSMLMKMPFSLCSQAFNTNSSGLVEQFIIFEILKSMLLMAQIKDAIKITTKVWFMVCSTQCFKLTFSLHANFSLSQL